MIGAHQLKCHDFQKKYCLISTGHCGQGFGFVSENIERQNIGLKNVSFLTMLYKENKEEIMILIAASSARISGREKQQ